MENQINSFSVDFENQQDVTQDYIIEQQQYIGKGSYGKIYLVPDKNGTLFNIEIIEQIAFEECDGLKEIMFNEIINTKKIQSAYVVKIVDFFSDDKNFFLVSQACNGGSLQDYIKARENKHFGEKEIKNFLVQLITGLKDLHSNQICHRDLNLQNIQIHNGIPKIKNLNFSQISEGFSTSGIGKSLFYPPQVLEIQLTQDRETKYDVFKVDIFSLGVIIFQIAEFKYLFTTKKNSEPERLKQIKAGPDFQDLVKRENPYSNEFYDLVAKMTTYKPENRYNMSQILNHPFLQFEFQLKPMNQQDLLEILDEERIQILAQFKQLSDSTQIFQTIKKTNQKVSEKQYKEVFGEEESDVVFVYEQEYSDEDKTSKINQKNTEHLMRQSFRLQDLESEFMDQLNIIILQMKAADQMVYITRILDDNSIHSQGIHFLINKNIQCEIRHLKQQFEQQKFEENSIFQAKFQSRITQFNNIFNIGYSGVVQVASYLYKEDQKDKQTYQFILNELRKSNEGHLEGFDQQMKNTVLNYVAQVLLRAEIFSQEQFRIYQFSERLIDIYLTQEIFKYKNEEFIRYELQFGDQSKILEQSVEEMLLKPLRESINTQLARFKQE